MRLRLLPSILAALLLAHCGSGNSDTSSGGDAGDAGDAGNTSDLLAPPADGQGVQFKMASHIEAGQEIERCKLFIAPPEGLLIHKDQVRFTPGSHHVLLYKTAYTSIPTMNRHGDAVKADEIHDCASGATDAWDVSGIVAGSQSSDGNTIVGELPDGVAITIDPGAVLLMDTHYLNASASGVDADARINLYTMAKADVKTEAGVLFYYNPFIRVPANGSSSAHMRCPIQQDISISRIQSHMHRRGVGFAATLLDGSGANPQQIYSTTAWEQVPAKDFAPLLQIKAGQSLDYQCDYKNVEPRDILQGQSTKDEMCVLVGPYFPRNAALEDCLANNQEPAASWIGSGTTTCADTLTCLGAATSDDAFYGCVVDSCPGASDSLSAVLRCKETQGHGACTSQCMNGDCASCVSDACSTEITACAASTCGG